MAWEPVREAAGLSPSTMSMWCNIHLQPVLEAYAEAQTVYALMNTSVSTVAAWQIKQDILKTTHWLKAIRIKMCFSDHIEIFVYQNNILLQLLVLPLGGSVDAQINLPHNISAVCFLYSTWVWDQ